MFVCGRREWFVCISKTNVFNKVEKNKTETEIVSLFLEPEGEPCFKALCFHI